MPKSRTQVPNERGSLLSLERHLGSPEPWDLSAVHEWVGSRIRPTAIDVFAGAGGLSLGLEWAGFDVLVGADFDSAAVETHSANLPGLSWCGDLADTEEFLETLAGWGIHTVDLLAGGVPCQPFSRAGRAKLKHLVKTGARSLDDPRAHLWRSYVEIVDALQPRAVLVENVPDLAAWDDGTLLICFMEDLRGLGYSVEAKVLEASRHGVPQHRNRLFMVGLRDGAAMQWPEPSAEPTTLREAIFDLPVVQGGQREEEISWSGPAEFPLAKRMRKGMPRGKGKVIHDHITRWVRDDDAEAFSLLGEGGTYAELPARLQRYRTDSFNDKYKRLSWDQPSRSITAHLAKDGYWYIHPREDRTISVREAARIQTFPDWFRFAGTPTLRYRQIGNAVPPILGEVVGRAVLEAMEASAGAVQASLDSDIRSELHEWSSTLGAQRPWRAGTASPWEALVGEVLLQRASLAKAESVFADVIALAPDPKTVVKGGAGLTDKLEIAGVKRARSEQLLEIAKMLIDLFDGEIPEDDLVVRELPGIGDFAAGAIAVFGSGRRSALVDAQTKRVLSRLRGHEVKTRWQQRLDVYALSGAEGPDAEFNDALINLAEAVCRPNAPKCEQCPLAERCAANIGGEGLGDGQLGLEQELAQTA